MTRGLQVKTIKKGRTFPGKPWIGEKIDCTDCGGRFQLEVGDSVKYNDDQRDGDYYSVKCPNCRATITWDA